MRLLSAKIVGFCAFACARFLTFQDFGASEAKVATQFAVPEIDETHRKIWLQFCGFIKQGDWAKAISTIDAELDYKSDLLLPPNDDGLVFPWEHGIHHEFSNLDAGGRRNFELLLGPRAQRLLDQGSAPDANNTDKDSAGTEEKLRRIFLIYGPSRAGSRAGDAWAKLQLASGDGRNAAAAWRWILEHGAVDAQESRAIRIELCRAYAAAGDREAFERAAAFAGERYGNDTIRVGGGNNSIDKKVADVLAEAAAEFEKRSSAMLQKPASAPARLSLSKVWDVPLQTNSEDNERSSSRDIFFDNSETDHFHESRDVAVYGNAVYLAYGGIVESRAMNDGSLLWTTGKRRRDNSCGPTWIRVAKDMLLVRNSKKNNFLRCMRASDGEQLWSTKDNTNIRIAGPPAVVDSTIYAAFAENASMKLHFKALSLADGKELWSLELGTAPPGASEGQEIALEAALAPVPKGIVVATDGGALFMINTKTRAVDFAFLHPSNIGFNMDGIAKCSMIVEGSNIYFTCAGDRELHALDTADGSILWNRIIEGGARIVAADDARFYILGRELCAYSRIDRSLKWARPMPKDEHALRPMFLDGNIMIPNYGNLLQLSNADGDNNGGSDLGGALADAEAVWDIGNAVLCIGDTRAALMGRFPKK
ncbi:MAG: PQQ-binding-like beta-propeller repeat protein [Planctomycetes bacterium]|nr:PQQ-binding-like beta-propeller repeat protein [Planctomycetota bacterium]